jgi:hypothetical protein
VSLNTGNIKDKGLRVIHCKVMVEGMSNLSMDFDFSKHFLYGKKNHVSFSYGATREEGIL